MNKKKKKKPQIQNLWAFQMKYTKEGNEDRRLEKGND